MDGWMDGWMDTCMYMKMQGEVYVWMVGCIHTWVDGWMDGWMYTWI